MIVWLRPLMVGLGTVPVCVAHSVGRIGTEGAVSRFGIEAAGAISGSGILFRRGRDADENRG